MISVKKYTTYVIFRSFGGCYQRKKNTSRFSRVKTSLEHSAPTPSGALEGCRRFRVHESRRASRRRQKNQLRFARRSASAFSSTFAFGFERACVRESDLQDVHLRATTVATRDAREFKR